ncbi:hypothetical protein HYFRA_00006207 [Hymenoscyphus fraxineus]|uniref:Protein kinase domain-containing protein n=1 Tax=Hymenoscyphus fraxineus TaxID=746836 RepID=A0A9N9PZQ2_9HELO|nr:hypothetical protein HYFRA_00006207 [Hymenoscyphus fraxineus]
MELNSDNIATLLYPVAAFNSPSIADSTEISHKAGSEQLKPKDCNVSTLNPKNRIDSLSEPANAKWRIDGSAGMGTQYYTVPIFQPDLIALRIDTFIPERKDVPVALHSALEIGPAFYTRDDRVARLGIARYIVRVLDYWSRNIPDFEAFYNDLPFGSRIVLQNIETDIRLVLRTHFLERQLLSIGSLQAMWNLPSESWPKTTDISNVTLLQQLHDSVSLVRHADQICIMKSLTSSPKYLYHELKVLLTMDAHTNVISRPSQLVVKRCKFGGKLAVVGFILDYYPAGTLRDNLSFRRTSESLKLQDQMKWSIQVTEAMIHIQKNGIMYCDLRLDNMVLDDGENVILIDFEARGVGTFISAPEITYLEYIHSLANETNENLGEEDRERYKKLLKKSVDGQTRPKSTEMYNNPRHGYCASWLCLGEEEREAAQVYMLGKVLWGIFEGVGSPEKGLLVSHLREDVLEYPGWRRTPEIIRELIKSCCFCERRCERFPLVREGQVLRLRDTDVTETVDKIQVATVKWWRNELRNAEDFIEKRRSGGSKARASRPKLEDVLVQLKSFMSFGSV